jgi:hypothetical protein
MLIALFWFTLFEFIYLIVWIQNSLNFKWLFCPVPKCHFHKCISWSCRSNAFAINHYITWRFFACNRSNIVFSSLLRLQQATISCYQIYCNPENEENTFSLWICSIDLGIIMWGIFVCIRGYYLYGLSCKCSFPWLFWGSIHKPNLWLLFPF